MEGIEVLATKTIQAPIVVAVVYTIIAAILILATVVWTVKAVREIGDTKFKRRQFGVVVLLLIVTIVTSFLATSEWVDRKTQAYNEYTVLIEDYVSFNDFNEFYEMVSHDGSGLYVVKDLKGD